MCVYIYIYIYIYIHTLVNQQIKNWKFCEPGFRQFSAHFLWKFCGGLRRMLFFHCKTTNTYRGDLRRRRIRESESQRRERPYDYVHVLPRLPLFLPPSASVPVSLSPCLLLRTHVHPLASPCAHARAHPRMLQATSKQTNKQTNTLCPEQTLITNNTMIKQIKTCCKPPREELLTSLGHAMSQARARVNRMACAL